jgi:hypothetical protein
MLPQTSQKLTEIFMTAFQKCVTIVTSKTFWAVVLLCNQYFSKQIDQTQFLTSLGAIVVAFKSGDVIDLFKQPKK